MKKFILLCAVAVMTLGFNSCKEETHIQEGYTFGILKYETTGLGDLAIFSNYLKSVGCPIGYEIFEGADQKETDAAAKKAFEGYAAKINKADLDALGLAPSSTYTYAAFRFDDPKNPNSQTLTIASYEYTAPAAK